MHMWACGRGIGFQMTSDAHPIRCAHAAPERCDAEAGAAQGAEAKGDPQPAVSGSTPAVLQRAGQYCSHIMSFIDGSDPTCECR